MGLSTADKQYLRRHNIPTVHKVSCNLCGAENLTKYVYGPLRISRVWAELCIYCHVQHGARVSIRGRGKIYAYSERTNKYETTIALTESYMQLLSTITTTNTCDSERKVRKSQWEI